MNSDFIKQAFYKQRYTGSRGNIVKTHHAMHKLTLSKFSLLSIILLPLLFDAVLWLKLDAIIMFWQDIFKFWGDNLDLTNRIFYGEELVFGRYVYMPYPDIAVSYPANTSSLLNIVFCVVIYLFSFRFHEKFLPIAYFIRALLLIQISASIYCLSNDKFPYDLGEYMSGVLMLSLYFIFFLPIMLALVYNIFNFSIIKKIIVSLFIITYFIIFIPFQYLACSMIMSYSSFLFMPLLYFNFGLVLDILMFIGLYSFAMSL